MPSPRRERKDAAVARSPKPSDAWPSSRQRVAAGGRAGTGAPRAARARRRSSSTPGRGSAGCSSGSTDLADEERALRAEADGLAVAAADVAAGVGGRRRGYRSPGARLPRQVLDGLDEWGARVHAALFVVRGTLETERERIVVEAKRSASAVLGEHLGGASVALVRRRLEAAPRRLITGTARRRAAGRAAAVAALCGEPVVEPLMLRRSSPVERTASAPCARLGQPETLAERHALLERVALGDASSRTPAGGPPRGRAR